MPRYVLLRHECPPDYEKPSHWDFMLEQDGKLLTWELRDLPKLWGEALEVAASEAAMVTAYPLADHRLAYLDYEGLVSGGRGTVTRCDGGNYRLLEQGEEQIVVELIDGKLNGVVRLVCEQEAWQVATGE